jgi:hypothetical protein
MKNRQELEKMQKGICRNHNCEFLSVPPESKLGVALETLGKSPINGLRHPPDKDTNGWYVWCGAKKAKGV